MELLYDTHTWFAISFVIFAFIVWRLGKDAIIKMLDGRIETIRKEIQTAEGLRVEAQELLAQYQRKQRDAMKDAEKIIADAREQAEMHQKQAEEDLKATMSRREAQLKGRLERMEQSAIQEIQAYATDLALKAATEIITEKLDKKTSESLVEQSIKDVGKHLH